MWSCRWIFLFSEGNSGKKKYLVKKPKTLQFLSFSKGQLMLPLLYLKMCFCIFSYALNAVFNQILPHHCYFTLFSYVLSVSKIISSWKTEGRFKYFRCSYKWVLEYHQHNGRLTRPWLLSSATFIYIPWKVTQFLTLLVFW